MTRASNQTQANTHLLTFTLTGPKNNVSASQQTKNPMKRIIYVSVSFSLFAYMSDGECHGKLLWIGTNWSDCYSGGVC